ncbi:MAG: flagellar hook-basal body complex protein FliE [Ruminococcus sp.]|nr:flagellar hook-basal body complex protein FliE [Ruminococcus sp.]
MFIVPMSNNISPVNSVFDNGNVTEAEKTEDGASFLDLFKSAYDNAEETQRVANEDSIKIMLGEVDDLSEVAINAQKAALALQTFVSLKNTAVDAYKEMMQISI